MKTNFTYDANGNMTSDRTNSYEWDAENRLIKITYPGTQNYSQFFFDAIGQNTRIVEVSGGSTTSTKQFVWAETRRCEARDLTGGVTHKYFGDGQWTSTGNYVYTMDHLGSVREMCDSSGAIQAQYCFDPFGAPVKLQGALDSDFQFSDYYNHSRSRLCLTRNRSYSHFMGRWISRDPLNEDDDVNMYAYVRNAPVLYKDPLGLYLVNENASNCLGHACSKGYVVPQPGHSLSQTMDELGYKCDKVKSTKECCCEGGFMFFILRSNLNNPWTDGWPTGQSVTNEFHAIGHGSDGSWTEVSGTWDPSDPMDQYRGRPQPTPVDPDQQTYLGDHKYCCCPKPKN